MCFDQSLILQVLENRHTEKFFEILFELVTIESDYFGEFFKRRWCCNVICQYGFGLIKFFALLISNSCCRSLRTVTDKMRKQLSDLAFQKHQAGGTGVGAG